MKKDLRQMLKALRDQGWTVALSKNGHYRCKSPSGELYVCSGTPSDYRGVRNMRADLRRLGALL